ncbi:hypothetical protein OKW33_002235 [Paraburkholderia atlantica]|uniref:Uncharacterized protein n=1 Tax=Paraburkholderia atlantica TaxID=2654982 RepID=A0A6I1PQ54_PARAM|nr:hypothetical protein [Paraburkholderia atlantica]MBB5416378.1 hypothetical protein [Paraburkholderia atlantica]MBB5426464.1 hypothetical protein [Paraburkholderia atlantica]MPW04324.1 hypothetical protein [Paraburkholderia atlantica]
MATLVRRLFKIALFIGLFLLSFRYVRISDPWTEGEARAWWGASDWLGVRDPENLYIGVWMTIELLAATLAYVMIMKLWRWSRT